uniref:Uncharacterized protein n=1 Tax=Rhizophora mucronata TaxID=61149 RepID=A0A2P2JYN1_RHIMU
MTYSFIQAIERGHGNTYGNMLNAMRSTISNTSNELGGGIVTSLLMMLLSGGSLVGGLRQVSLLLQCCVAACSANQSPSQSSGDNTMKTGKNKIERI